MSDMDVFAAMGIGGFGKKTKQRQLDPKRFEKNKRSDMVRGSQTFVYGKELIDNRSFHLPRHQS